MNYTRLLFACKSSEKKRKVLRGNKKKGKGEKRKKKKEPFPEKNSRGEVKDRPTVRNLDQQKWEVWMDSETYIQNTHLRLNNNNYYER